MQGGDAPAEPGGVQVVWTVLPGHIPMARHGTRIYIDRVWWGGCCPVKQRRVVRACLGLDFPPPGYRFWGRCPAARPLSDATLSDFDCTLLMALLGLSALGGG